MRMGYFELCGLTGSMLFGHEKFTEKFQVKMLSIVNTTCKMTGTLTFPVKICLIIRQSKEHSIFNWLLIAFHCMSVISQ